MERVMLKSSDGSDLYETTVGEPRVFVPERGFFVEFRGDAIVRVDKPSELDKRLARMLYGELV